MIFSTLSTQHRPNKTHLDLPYPISHSSIIINLFPISPLLKASHLSSISLLGVHDSQTYEFENMTVFVEKWRFDWMNPLFPRISFL